MIFPFKQTNLVNPTKKYYEIQQKFYYFKHYLQIFAVIFSGIPVYIDYMLKLINVDVGVTY